MHSISKLNEGGKARGLRLLQANGFKVPDFVVVQSTFEKSVIEHFVKKYPASSFAVRSSSYQEDGMEHSFAGQFETFLNIRGLSSIENAINACFEAANSSRVDAYTAAKSVQKDAQDTMAVVVQQMIEAQYAGVAFSVDPVQNRRDLCLIQYVEGAGHQLVDGKRKAASLLLAKKQVLDCAEAPIPLDTVKEIKEGIILLEQLSGYPVDVEWVIDKNGQLYWLQLRPVTSLSPFHANELDSRICFEGETLTRANVGEMMPGHMTPLTISTFGWAIEYGIQHFYKECGIINEIQKEHHYIKFFYNHGFISIGNLYKIADAMLLPKYEYVEFSLLGRSLQNRITPAYPVGFIKQLINQIKQIRYLSKATKRLAQIEAIVADIRMPKDHSPQKLYDWIDAQLQVLNTVYAYHYCTSARSGTLYTTLLSIISGSPMPNEKSLQTLPYFLKNIPDIEGYLLIESLQNIQQLLANELQDVQGLSDVALLDYLQQSSSAASKAFHKFLERHGHHCVREAELSEIDWSQNPLQLMSSLKNAPNTTDKFQSIAAEQLIQEYLPEMKGIKKKIFLRFIKQLREAVYMRERSKSLSIKFQQYIKKTYLNLGAILVNQNMLTDVKEIFYLTHREIGQLLDGSLKDTGNRIRSRILLDKQYQQFIFHELYTQYPYPVEKENTTDQSTGTVVSQGVVRGRIRLVHNLEEAQFLEDGDIMVCQYTDIGWTPYFSRIAGLITEIGSALSHGAVIAREYGLPAVVNYSNALQIFENGQLIELNTENNPPVLMVE